MSQTDQGRVRINDVEAKPARETKVGDTVVMRSGAVVRTVIVLGISGQRETRWPQLGQSLERFARSH